MLKILGMSIAENLLMGVNRYGHCLTKSLAGAARRAAIGWIAFVKPGWPLENPPPSRSFYLLPEKRVFKSTFTNGLQNVTNSHF